MNLFSLVYGILRFTIDFITVDADIAFHIGVRFDENKIIRNSNKGGWGRNEWNNEERDGPFPFRRAQRFGLVINLLLNKFQVCIFNYPSFFR